MYHRFPVVAMAVRERRARDHMGRGPPLSVNQTVGVIHRGWLMNENMVDVLIYLYENYMDGDGQPPVEQRDLEDELTQAGFTQGEIDKALRWLDELALGVEAPRYHAHAPDAIRVYSEHECRKLDMEARGALMLLEHDGILDPVSRELVIDRLLAIDHPHVLVDEVRWVALLVLMNQPGREDAFMRLEDMVYGDAPRQLH